MSTGRTAISKVMGRLLNIQPGERRTVLLLLAFSFLSGVSFVFYSTASISIFVSTFKAQMMPYAFIASGIVGYLLWLFFARIQRSMSFGGIIFAGYIFLLLSILFLVVMSSTANSGAWHFALFVWMRFYTFLNAVMFGALFARVFDARQGKRLFALISTGDVISQMIGYFSIPFLTKWMGISTLFTISMTGIGVLLCFLVYLRKAMPNVFQEKRAAGKAVKQQEKKERVVTETEKNYFKFIFLMSMLPMLGFYYVDYLFLNQLKMQYHTGDALAGFLGLFLGMVAIVELLVRLFVSSRLLTTYGLRFGIYILPVVLLLIGGLIIMFSSISGLSVLVFSILALGKLLEKVCRFAFNEPAFQLFYQPVAEENRFVFRARMEGVPKALGVVLAGLLILALNSLGFQNLFYLTLLFVVVLVVWLLIAGKAYHYYSRMLMQYVRQLFSGVTHTDTRQLAGTIPSTAQDAYRAFVTRMETQKDEPNERWVMNFMLTTPMPAKELAPWLNGNKRLVQAFYTRFGAAEQVREKIRILELLSHVNEAVDFITDQALSDDLAVSAIALRFMEEKRLSLPASAHTRCRTKVHDIMALLAWYEATINDTGGEQESNCQLVQALYREKKWFVDHLFRLLGLIYDEMTIKAIRNSLVQNRTADSKILAVELAEHALDVETKKHLMALLLSDDLEEQLEALQDSFPQQRMDMGSRLVDIIRKDYQLVPVYVKQLALFELSQTYSPLTRFYDVFVECLQNEHEGIVLTTAGLLRDMAPEKLALIQPTLKARQQKIIATQLLDTPHTTHLLAYELNSLDEVPGMLLPALLTSEEATALANESTVYRIEEGSTDEDAESNEPETLATPAKATAHGHYFFSDPAVAAFFG